jgi:AcrR family transcriptional regulator
LPARSPSRRDVRWVGLSAESRRAERRSLLLDAAFDLLGTEGWAGTTVRAVCKRAELNPRYFYESFEDLDALVVAVYDRVIAELADTVEKAQAATDETPAALVRAAVEAIVSFVDDDRRRARILYVEALGNEALNRRRIATGHALVVAVEQHAAARVGRLPRGEQAGRIGAAILVGGLSELLVEWIEGGIAVSRRRLVDDVTTMVLALGDATASIVAARRAK